MLTASSAAIAEKSAIISIERLLEHTKPPCSHLESLILKVSLLESY